MAAKKRTVAPVSADVINTIVAQLKEETTARYTVADKIEIDWCPCCGINIRMRNAEGELFAKFIAPSPWVARKIAVDLLAMAQRAAEIADTPDILKRAQDDMLAAAMLSASKGNA